MSTSGAAPYRALLERLVAGRPWLSASDVAIAAAAEAQKLLDLGAERVFAIGASRGTGELPSSDRLELAWLDVQGEDLMSSLRRAQDALADLPDDVRRRIDAFDPEGAARCVGSHYGDGRPVAGRRVLGARLESWRLLEDKTKHDELWERAGVPYARGLVVAPTASSFARATAELGIEGDAVLAGDSREGFNGGATHVRWVRDADGREAAASFFSARCDRVRVMPFLEGLPCSIHGFVFPEHVATFRPCEMLVLRDVEQPAFVYTGSASFWDAPPALAEEMRDIARRVGDRLRADVGYRGAFTIDGVATREGFRPTELNPRFGAALVNMTRRWSELPLYFLHLAVVEGHLDDDPPGRLEEVVRARVDEHRGGQAIRVLRRHVPETTRIGLVRDGAAWRRARDDEPTDAVAELGPGTTGGFLRVALDPDRTPRGPSAAPRARDLLRWLDAELGLDLGELEVADDAGAAPRAEES